MYAQVCLPFLQCNLPLPLFFVALKLGEVCLKSLVVVEQGTFKRMHRVKGSRQETPQYGKASRRQQKKKKITREPWSSGSKGRVANKEPGHMSILWNPQKSLKGKVYILGSQEFQTQIIVIWN